MKDRIIATYDREGFTAQLVQPANATFVTITADADIDADGANGQHGRRPAYMVGDLGSEALANGGMKMSNGRVVGVTTWFRDIVVLDGDQPKVFPGGIIASKTALHLTGFSPDDPRCYVDSETVPYVVAPPELVTGVKGIVLGSWCVVTNLENGESANAVVADVGPRRKVGEVSIQLARLLGIPASPRTGGTDRAIIEYRFFPGIAAAVVGIDYHLQRS